MKLVSLFKKIYRALLNKIDMMNCNEMTIENYFRKQGCQIGTNNRIFILSLGTEPYLIRIGNHCTITAGVIFLTHDGSCWIYREEMPDLNKYGTIEIKDNCFIGINSILMPNITIGPNSIVGAGSVVTKDVPPDTIVAGVPAKVICSVTEYKEKCAANWAKMGINGPRETWPEQLKAYFWGKK